MGTTESDWTFHQVFGDRGEDIDFQDIAEGMYMLYCVSHATLGISYAREVARGKL